jgi:hypothetical protein
MENTIPEAQMTTGQLDDVVNLLPVDGIIRPKGA